MGALIITAAAIIVIIIVIDKTRMIEYNIRFDSEMFHGT